MSNLKQIMTLTFLFLSLCLSACTKPIQDVSIKTETSSAISEPSIIKPSEENSMQGSDVSLFRLPCKNQNCRKCLGEDM